MKLFLKLMSAAVLLSSQSHAGIISVQYDANVIDGGTGTISGTFQFEAPDLSAINYSTGPTDDGHYAINAFAFVGNPVSSYSTNIEGMSPMSGTAIQSSGYGVNTSSTGVMADGPEVFEMGFSHDLGNGDDLRLWLTILMPEPMYDFNFGDSPEMIAQAILNSGFLSGAAFYNSSDYNMIADISSFSFSMVPEATSVSTQGNNPASRVPDPESLFLFATGLVALYFSRRRMI